MRPNPRGVSLTGRQILLRFHERSTALHVAQSHALPRHLLRELLGVEGGTRGCALVRSPPSRSEDVLCQVLG